MLGALKLMKIQLNKNEYSEESKRSVGYSYLGKFYADIEYDCWKCKKREVFSAEDQKYTYEVKKLYMWARRVLCKKCWQEERLLKNQLQDIEKQYCTDKEVKLNDEAFLRNWLKLLEEYPTYGKKGNNSRMKFIKKHLTRDYGVNN